MIHIETKLLTRAIRTAIKVIRFSRGGFSVAERRELTADLLELAALLAEDIADDIGKGGPG